MSSHSRERMASAVHCGPVRERLSRITPLGAALAMLTTALRGRPPVFHSEQWLEPGVISWLDESLPDVFVAPDLFERLCRAFSRSGGST